MPVYRACVRMIGSLGGGLPHQLLVFLVEVFEVKGLGDLRETSLQALVGEDEES